MEELTAAHRRVLCKLCGIKHDEDIVPDYPTWDTGNDMVAVKEAIEREKKWHEFWRWTHEKFRKIQEENNRCVWLKSEHTAWLLQPERFCLLVAEWKIQQKGDK